MLAKQIQKNMKYYDENYAVVCTNGNKEDVTEAEIVNEQIRQHIKQSHLSLIETMIERLELQKNAFWKYSDKYEENNIATKTFHQVLDYEIDYLKAEKAIIKNK